MIAISATIVQQRLLICVEDRGSAAAVPSRPGGGTGLNYVRSLLKERFGDRARLTTARTGEIGFRAIITIDLEDA
jgi:LytS/YehU family sensor histidine kinase